jgi:uncharacterized protein YbjQ (UPF0145 family)
MAVGDDENPELIPAEMPAAEMPPSEEPKEFLVQEQEQSVNLSDLTGNIDGTVIEQPLPDGEAGGEPSGELGTQSVDDLLASEIPPEALGIPEPAPALPEHPTFQLQFRNLSGEARPALKKVLEAQGVSVTDKSWAATMPVISQLSEYQAVVLLQAANALGCGAEATVLLPGALPSEEDLALGDLSNIPDAGTLAVEAAPSVTLPKGEKEVLLCTPDSLPGGTVRETFGIVIAHRSIARRLFREEDLRDKLQKELRSVPGKPNAVLPSSHLQILLRELMLDLRKSALAKGGNAVLGVKLEAFPESGAKDPQLEQLRLVAFGTAAVVEKS